MEFAQWSGEEKDTSIQMAALDWALFTCVLPHLERIPIIYAEPKSSIADNKCLIENNFGELVFKSDFLDNIVCIFMLPNEGNLRIKDLSSYLWVKWEGFKRNILGLSSF